MDIGNIFEEWDFSGTVPLPYRVLLMGCIGIFAWASNLHILAHLRVDVSNLLFSSPPLPGLYNNNSNSSSILSNNSNSNTRHHLHRDKFNATKSTPLSALYRSIYTLGAGFLSMTLINMWMYKWVVAGSEPATPIAKTAAAGKTTFVPPAIGSRGGMGHSSDVRAGVMVPILGYLTIVCMIFVPVNVLFKKERYRFLRSMRHVMFSGLWSEVSFADVILADILTSFARVFGDLSVALCLMFWDRDGKNTDACYGSILVPVMTSIPYCIRLRQCLAEYIESNYTTERHLMNALKYASAFPVIIVSALQKSVKAASLKGQANTGYFSDNSLFRLWLLFVAINSFYSFYWDIYHDWNLVQVHTTTRTSPLIGSVPSNTESIPLGPVSSSSSQQQQHHHHHHSSSSSLSSTTTYSKRYSMRAYLHYEDRTFYYVAAVLDFLLRTTWMLKLFSNIQIEEYEGGVFTMQCLEVLRRWIWVIFRLEAEMVKRAGYSDSHGQLSAGLNGGFPGSKGSEDQQQQQQQQQQQHDSSNVVLMQDLESWQQK
ncbi:protein-ER retention protein [Podila epigama]|nr:protein-ER retention protein [Podila epigama]